MEALASPHSQGTRSSIPTQLAPPSHRHRPRLLTLGAMLPPPPRSKPLAPSTASPSTARPTSSSPPPRSLETTTPSPAPTPSAPFQLWALSLASSMATAEPSQASRPPLSPPAQASPFQATPEHLSEAPHLPSTHRGPFQE